MDVRQGELMRMSAASYISRLVHDGQKDLSGADFYTHPQTVAELVYGYGVNHYIVALLHDTLEDCPDKITASFIRSNFGDDIADAVVAITRNDGEKYFDYIVRCSQNPLAKVVKIADIRHNSWKCRFTGSDKAYVGLMKRYRKALNMLGVQESGEKGKDDDHD